MKIKPKIKLIWSHAGKTGGVVFAIALFFAVLPANAAAECVQVGTELVCCGSTYNNADMLSRVNPRDNVEVFTIDGTDSPVEINRNGCISAVSLINESSWEKDATVNLKGDVSINSAWRNNSRGVTVGHEGSQGSIFINTSSLSSINTIGLGSTGLNYGIYGYISGKDSPGDIHVDASGDITTAGKNSHGIYAHHQGQGGIEIDSTGEIDTTGQAAHGIYGLISSNDNEADISVAVGRGKIQTNGETAHGVYLENRGTGDIFLEIGENAMIGAAGENSSGLYVKNDGGGDNTLNVAGMVLGRDEDYGHAIVSETYAGGKSHLNLEDTADIRGSSGKAIVNKGGDSDTTAAEDTRIIGGIDLGDGSDTLSFNGTDISGITRMDGGDDSSAADGWVDTLRFNGVTGERAGEDTVNWEKIQIDQSSEITASGKWHTGAIDDAQTGIWIKNDSTLHIVHGFHLTGNLHIDQSAMLSGVGSDYTVTGAVNNSGTINLHNNSAEDTFTIEGDYHGDNGQLQLDTFLGGDDSDTDRLIVDGNTSGSTDIFIYNAGGDGDETVDGIEIINVSGDSEEEHFSLANVVEADAYEYFLFRGTPDEENDHFYLRSQYTGPGPSPDPVYRSAIPGYVLGQSAMQEMVYTSMSSLHQRVGEQQTLKWDYCGCDPEKPEDQFWARMVGQHLDIDGDRQFGHEQDMFLLQLGKDFLIGYDDDDHSHRHTGFMLSYGETEADFHDRHRRAANLGYVSGEMNGKMAAFGLYHTRYADNGFYQDFVGQIHYNRNKYTDMNGQKADNYGTGAGLSAEIGRPWQIGESLWLIEPQAQVRYQLTRYTAFSDNVSTVDQFTTENLRGRAGARLAWNDRIDGTERTKTIYLTANLLHDFLDPESISVNGDSIREKPDSPTWGEVGINGQYRLTDASYIHGSMNYQRSIDDSSREGYGGKLGVRIAW